MDFSAKGLTRPQSRCWPAPLSCRGSGERPLPSAFRLLAKFSFVVAAVSGGRSPPLEAAQIPSTGALQLQATTAPGISLVLPISLTSSATRRRTLSAFQGLCDSIKPTWVISLLNVNCEYNIMESLTWHLITFRDFGDYGKPSLGGHFRNSA